MNATVQIFLSYAREDEEKVENLYQKLSDEGFKPWMDKKDILPGERWQPSIRKAVRRSDFFLACLSANSVNKRGFIHREIRDALAIWQEMLDSDIYVIPVRLEDCEVPESLHDFQWVNLFEEDGWTLLVRAIQAGMERRGFVRDEQSKTDVIKWSNSGNLFWATHDLMLTFERLSHGAPKEAIFFTLQQSLYHVRALGFKGPPIESKLTELTTKAAEDLRIREGAWPPELLRYYTDELESLKNAIGELASTNQPDFNPGPKTSKPVIIQMAIKEVINARSAGIVAAAFEVFATEYAWDTLGITINRQPDWMPDLFTYDVSTDDIDPRGHIVGRRKQLSIRFQTLANDQVEMSVQEHNRNIYSELTPRQLQELVRDFPEKFIDYFQATVPKPTEQIYTEEESEEEIEHVKELLSIHRKNLQSVQIRAAQQGMNIDTKTQNEIEYEKREIAQLHARLKSLRSKHKPLDSSSTF